MHPSRLGTVGLATMLLLVVATGPASASQTATMDPLHLTKAGCQVKGLGGFAYGPGGSLALGTYAYLVSAITGTGEVAPICPAVVVAVVVASGQNNVALRWTPTAGAVSYRIYRGATPGQATEIATVAATSAGCGAAGARQCLYGDTGLATPTATTPPATPQPDLVGGHHPDLRVSQHLDYGGAAADSTDDPFPDDNGQPAALATDVLRLPHGLTLNTHAAARCPLTGSASLLGSVDLHGANDPDEDTCPLSTLVGEVALVSNITALGVRTVQGDVYLGAVKGTERGRVFVAIRPPCAAGSPMAPGSASCNATVGSGHQLDKVFLAGVVTRTTRDGKSVEDVSFRQAQDDGTLPSSIVVRMADGNQFTALRLQIQSFVLRLYGLAEQFTPTHADDVAFVTTPTACGKKTVVARTTSYADPAMVSVTRSFSPTRCVPAVTVKVSRTAHRITAHGSVQPSSPGVEMKVTLERRRDGSYRTVTTKRPPLNTSGAWRTSFSRPNAGKCRIIARYPGDPNHRAATVTHSFSC